MHVCVFVYVFRDKDVYGTTHLGRPEGGVEGSRTILCSTYGTNMSDVWDLNPFSQKQREPGPYWPLLRF